MAMAALAVVGLAIAAYLVYTRYADVRLICTTGACETVQHSRYAKLLGVPVALIGLAGYASILAAALARGDAARAAGVALTVGAAAFAAYLLVIQVAVIGAICQWCVASDVVVSALAALALLRVLAASGHRRPRTTETARSPSSSADSWRSWHTWSGDRRSRHQGEGRA
jgi:uncharacterized membrane protein